VPKRDGKEKAAKTKGAVRTDSVADVINWIFNGTLAADDLRRIEVAARRSRKSLAENHPEQGNEPAKSYYQRWIRGHLYWYQGFYKNGKHHSVYVGKELPKDLDERLVSISRRQGDAGR